MFPKDAFFHFRYVLLFDGIKPGFQNKSQHKTIKGWNKMNTQFSLLRGRDPVCRRFEVPDVFVSLETDPIWLLDHSHVT